MRTLTAAKVQALVGKPYLKHGRGPDGYDCWGVVCALARVPDEWTQGMESYRAVVTEFVKAEALNEKVLAWHSVPLAEAASGDIVALGRNAHYAHAGIWFEGSVVHAVEGSGVVLSSLTALRALGWSRIGIYRWKPE